MTPREWTEKESFSFDDLVAIVALLRSPEGCSWDRVQTHRSLRNNFVEEVYEVCEGIDKNDNALLCEELGDVLLQVVFHSGIAKDEEAFTIEDVVSEICKKMIRRHPHIFGNETEPVDWEEIKKKEKGEASLRDTLSRVSTSLPALKRGEKFIRKGAVEPTACEGSSLAEKGRAFYDLCKACVQEKIDPEEALNAYLGHIIENCTNCE